MHGVRNSNNSNAMVMPRGTVSAVVLDEALPGPRTCARIPPSDVQRLFVCKVASVSPWVEHSSDVCMGQNTHCRLVTATGISSCRAPAMAPGRSQLKPSS